jgi:hypothetical protein
LALVRDRAANRCEYCHFPQTVAELPFQLDHIVALKHGGQTSADNLAYACFFCNSYKGPNIAGTDPVSGEVTRLFHPRSDRWADHFEWEGAIVRAKTAVGRATISVLRLNHPDAAAVREALLVEGALKESPTKL